MINKNNVSFREDLKLAIDETSFNEVDLEAERILPTITTNYPAGNVKTIPAGEGQRQEETRRPNDGSFRRVNWVAGEDTYQTTSRGIEERVDAEEALESADYWTEELVAAEITRNTLLIGREARVSDAVFNTTTFSGDDAKAVNNNWNNSDTSLPTPFQDVDNAIERVRAKTGIARNQLSLILTDSAIKYLLRTDVIRGDIKYTENIHRLSKEQKLQFLAQFFHIKEVIEVTAMENTSELGVKASFGRIWDTSYGMVSKLCNSELNSWKIPGLGRQPAWSKVAKDYVMESYPENQTDAEIIRARERRGEKVFSKFGCLLTGVIT